MAFYDPPRSIRSLIEEAALALIVAALAVGAATPSAKTAAPTAPAAAGVFAGWYEGAAGYRQALADQAETGKPILVYFHAPWCPYCRRVNESLLAMPAVVEAISGILAVQINGDGKSRDRKLMDEFGAKIYPSFFLRRASDAKFEPLRVFATVSRVREPEDFAAELRGVPPGS